MNRVTLYTIATLLLATTTARSSAQEATNARQLQEVVVLGGKQKTLSSRGTRIPGAVSMLTPEKMGCEVGTTFSTRHRFEVEEIEFDIVSSSIKDATLSIQIYRDSTFTPLLSHPIFVIIPEGKRQTIIATPTERTLLEIGEYIVAITLADCNESTKQEWTCSEQWDSQTRYQMMKQSIQFPLYLKAGYIKSSVHDSFEKCPASIGLKVKGRVCHRFCLSRHS